MRHLKNIIEFKISSCLRCGSIFSDDSLFCHSCYQGLRSAYGPRLGIRFDPVKTSYLFQWSPWASDSLSQLLIEMKGTKNKSAWTFYALEFWRAYCAENKFIIPQQSLLVPAPAKSLYSLDHAGLFCKALSEVSGLPRMPLLMRTSSSVDQKMKNKIQRRQIKIEIHEKISRESVGPYHIILVDDVLTTGATALAAKQSLLGVKSFEVWALASRSLSCGNPLNLL